LLCLYSLYQAYSRASYKVSKTFKPTNSDAKDFDVSGQYARLSFVETLASDLRPAPDAARQASEAREERSGMHLIDTLVLLPAGAFYCGTHKHYSVVKCTPELFFVNQQKAEMSAMFCLRAAGVSSPFAKAGAFTSDFHYTDEVYIPFTCCSRALPWSIKCCASVESTGWLAKTVCSSMVII
jgi:hypothetical protein